MLSKEQNDLVTQTGPDTPGGKLFRQYWQPIALVADIEDDQPIALKVMDEELVLFRDEEGKLGLLGLHCPHRGGDLSYGRIEAGGLRCVYHGWVFDVNGKCLEQPAEPPGHEFCNRIKQKSYPLKVLGGMIFTYMGTGEPPALPEWECLLAPESHRFISRSREHCNWLQGFEGDIDPYHLSFLHLALNRAKTGVGTSAIGPFHEFFTKGVPRMEVERTDFGVRIYAMRDLGDQSYLRLSNYVLPNIAAVAGGAIDGDGYMMLWHVPIDDVSHVKYQLAFKRSKPVDIEKEKADAVMHWKLGSSQLPERNATNRWMQDRKSMKDEWFAGLGSSFALHDNWATETMGPIYDRSQEHLGHGDKGIVGARRALLQAIEDQAAGGEIPFHLGERQAMKDKINEIVVTSLLAPDKDKYREVFQDLLAASNRKAAE